MAKGYVIVDIHVHDKEDFGKSRETAKPVLEEYGAKVLTDLKVFYFFSLFFIQNWSYFCNNIKSFFSILVVLIKNIYYKTDKYRLFKWNKMVILIK